MGWKVTTDGAKENERKLQHYGRKRGRETSPSNPGVYMDHVKRVKITDTVTAGVTNYTLEFIIIA
jgi:hypothetical protein